MTGDTLGTLLKEARLQRGLTLEQVAQQTKIRQRHLEALERDDLAAVPNAFYRRAEIRTFAQAVHLDERLAIAALERASRPATLPVEIEDAPSAESLHSFGRPATPVLLAIAALIVGALLWTATPGHAPDVGASAATAAGTGRSLAQEGRNQDSLVSSTDEEPGRDPVAAAHDIPMPAGTSGSSDATPAVAATIDTAATPPTRVTQLVVTTEPAGARVTVNGIGWGTAPIAIGNIAAGAKRIRVSKQGFATDERVVSVTQGDTLEVDIQLRSLP